MIIPLIIYGSRGRVGSQLVRYIHALTDAPVRIVGMIESDRHYLSSDGIHDENFTYQLGVPTLHDIQEVCHGKPAVIVDATAAKDSMRELHRKIISETPHTIIPANKNPISLYAHDIFEELTADKARYSYDTTVMAGAGVVPFLLDRVAVGDHVSQVSGVFSGTLGYIFSTSQKGEKSFSQIIKEAYDMGYTEPHPYDDLGGVDVARKLLIIARTLGKKVELTDIRLDPVVPQDLYDEDVDTFLENCKALDEAYETRRQTALKDGKVLRYVAQYSDQGEMVVGIQEVDTHGPLGTLGGTHNIAIMQTDSYAIPYPHIIQSRGAGLEVTAYSLLAQILRACQSMASE